MSKPYSTFEFECDEKTYISMGSIQANYVDAWSECCSWGGLPVSIDSAEELECVQRQLYQRKNDTVQYWTSQVDIRLEGKIRSCITSEEVPSDILWPVFVNKNEACAVLTLSPKVRGLVNTKCNIKAALLCQLYPADKVNARYSARTNKTLQKENLLNCKSFYCPENIKVEPLPLDTIVINKCSKPFYIINTIKDTLKNAWTHCCKYGLVVASIESKNDTQCISRSKPANAITFQTSAMDSHLKNEYISCVSGKKVPREVWAKRFTVQFPVHDNKNEACVVLSYIHNYLGLTNVPCDNQNRTIFCENEPINNTYWITEKKARMSQNIASNVVKEVPLSTPSKYYSLVASNHFLLTRIADCESAVCTSLKKSDSKNDLIKDSDLLKCKKNTFYISKKESTAAKSWSDCCAVGLVPGTVSSTETFDCLKNLAKTNKDLKSPLVLHTAMVDASLDRKFISCVSGQPVSSSLFHPKEPDNKQGSEACLAVNISGVNVGLVDIPCNTFAPVLCEVPENMIKFQTPWVFNLLKPTTVTKKMSDITTTGVSGIVNKQGLSVNKNTPSILKIITVKPADSTLKPIVLPKVSTPKVTLKPIG